MLTKSLEINQNNSKNKNEKKVKRSMSWSHLLLPSYKTRLIEFRRLFHKTIPQNERLIADFICALQREILIQGRLYLSVNYLSFHANIFGWETIQTIRLCDITAITKANTIRVIPNAIQVITSDGNKYIFTSFVARDKAFKRIYRLWQDIIIGQKMSVSEVWQLIRYNYGMDLGLSSDSSDEDEEELNPIIRDNINIVEEEVDDEVFEESVANVLKSKRPRHDSISSFLTCPESELEEELNLLGADEELLASREGNVYKCANFLKYFFSPSTRETLYLRIVLVLSLVLLLFHSIILYKISKFNFNQTFNVNIDELKQLADLTTRLVRRTDYSGFQ